MRKTGPSKADTSLLEPFAGLTLANIIVPRTEAEFAAAAQDIRAARQVGFDTESKPTFRVGEVSTGPHVVQFALPGRAYIFQLHHAACVPVVAALLQDRAVLKIGFGLSSDHSQIRAKLGISPCAVLDLNNVYRKLGYNSSMGARAAVGLTLGRNFRKSKAVTTTNWAQPALTDSQLLYAANDAYAALRVFEALDLPAQDLPED
ncbi:MAG: 3'-5' exonuclease domain-containing protein 2 [Gammaproteobacteria bacterium]|jgi:ribonuclease D|nr:3'-5' exonuclease domain-containing protein 2 [Gammaproteobacteria bacterium]MBU0772220.1 3'-5' exonuclease domain-containing protein 2 [Gammaproteobacteria bacterium]MBU0855283.1 3'-5' exonuclease domain-containing protein 2 [Gammaproteobacteria bacterium]MBU1848347.1 3'-5' exonuclease domain-containing protein 2 [Gammaproteobacteria bacterium]